MVVGVLLFFDFFAALFTFAAIEHDSRKASTNMKTSLGYLGLALTCLGEYVGLTSASSQHEVREYGKEERASTVKTYSIGIVSGYSLVIYELPITRESPLLTLASPSLSSSSQAGNHLTSTAPFKSSPVCVSISILPPSRRYQESTNLSTLPPALLRQLLQTLHNRLQNRPHQLRCPTTQNGHSQRPNSNLRERNLLQHLRHTHICQCACT